MALDQRREHDLAAEENRAGHLQAALAIDAHLREAELRGPGAEPTFGGLVFSHDLIHNIGGEEDSNANLTRRMLLLLESTALGRDEAYVRVVNHVLSRYILEDFGWMNARNPMNVPRFLHNDIVRYWRTIAVDFAYKRRQRAGQGWALRTAKLRMSRKLIVEFLAAFVRKTPLQIFAELFIQRPELDTVAGELFGTYDPFSHLLDDKTQRAQLDGLRQEDVASDPVYQRVRGLGRQFQAALNGVFLDSGAAPDLFDLTKPTEYSSAPLRILHWSIGPR